MWRLCRRSPRRREVPRAAGPVRCSCAKAGARLALCCAPGRGARLPAWTARRPPARARSPATARMSFFPVFPTDGGCFKGRRGGRLELPARAPLRRDRARDQGRGRRALRLAAARGASRRGGRWRGGGAMAICTARTWPRAPRFWWEETFCLGSRAQATARWAGACPAFVGNGTCFLDCAR